MIKLMLIFILLENSWRNCREGVIFLKWRSSREPTPDDPWKTRMILIIIITTSFIKTR